MRAKSWIFGAACLFLILTAAAAPAFYCGNALIDRGDTTIEVRHACGPPDSVQSWDEVENVSHWRYGYLWHSLETVHVEQWIYNFGPYRFIRILRFENGILKRIKSGDYGFSK